MLHEVGGRGYPLALFEQQLRYLTRHFTISPLLEALARLRNDTIAGDEVVLTFDDGLESHATRVYPVLERLRVPASFFVCPGLIERGEGIWTLEARARLAVLPPDKFLAWVRENGLPDCADVDGALAWMKRLPRARRLEVTARLRHLPGTVSDDNHQFPVKRLMSWEQLRSLDTSLVTIGSHSLTHSILTLLEPTELEREIHEAQELLVQRLGCQARVFCYPEGALDARVVEVARRYYDAALTTDEGFARPGDNLYTLRRIPFAQSLPLLAWRLFKPTA
jgi:peptidoglycan/xylan/chitin deacetylase (PgdA/CDA1 family)